MLHLYSSNFVERLADQLGTVLEEPLKDPCAPEIIMVHSRGLERWLSLQLAERLGVCANITFPYPAPFLSEVMEANLPDWDEQASRAYDLQSMVWSLMAILPDLAEADPEGPIAHYLGREEEWDDARRYQLAQCLAHLFDRYLIYRPQLLKRWEQGRVMESEAWQAKTWRLLASRESHHRALLRERFFEWMKSNPAALLAKVPERFCVFGIASLAPFYIEILGALSSRTEIHLFFLNPCAEYWGDILSRKQRARMKRRGKLVSDWDQMELGLSAEPDFANDLLASFGQLGRDFFDILLDQSLASQHESFVEIEGRTLLACLQRDILHLQEGAEQMDADLESKQRSIEVHVCHSRMREVEVLNDVLLDLFENDPTLEPRDIIVMAPRIEDYTHKIQAVFARAEGDERFIPYGLADRNARSSQALGQVFLRLIDLAKGRWLVSEVLGILENEPVMRRFGLTESNLEQIRRWIDESGIRWGRDGESKEHLNLPSVEENTWRFGLDRLLLGVALPLKGKDLFEGVLPYDEIEGDDVSVLAAFLDYWGELERAIALIQRPHSVDEWTVIGAQLVGTFFLDDPEYDRELSFLYELFESLRQSAELVNFDEKIDITVIRQVLNHRLGETVGAGDFFTGGVTFCDLVPMRSLPFKVVVLLGMNRSDFPRQDHAPSFDLMAQQMKRGDRSRPLEDRYMFLEALLAAREKLLVFYTGQSIKDNTEISPSSFVIQLQEYISRVYGVGPDVYQINQRLQPFSRNYFTDSPPYFSYAREYAELPEQHTGANPVGADLRLVELPERANEGATKEVHLDELIRFFEYPVAAFYRHHFQIYQREDEREIEDVEPFESNPLELWKIQQWLLELLTAHVPPKKMVALLRASGRLAPGSQGDYIGDLLQREAARFEKELPGFYGGEKQPPVPVDLTLDGVRLIGEIQELYPNGHCSIRLGALRPKDKIRLWIEHLAWQSMEMSERGRSQLLGEGGNTWKYHEYDTPHGARHDLKDLLAIREKGLLRPLRLFPNSSWTYVYSGKGPQDPEKLKSAYRKWRGDSRFSKGEKDQFYHHLAFGLEENPLNAEFQELSVKVIKPMLENSKNA